MYGKLKNKKHESMKDNEYLKTYDIHSKSHYNNVELR